VETIGRIRREHFIKGMRRGADVYDPGRAGIAGRTSSDCRRRAAAGNRHFDPERPGRGQIDD
jgi:hypothetical protein